MPKLPVLQDKDLVKIIEKLGFIFRRQKGSHRVFKHSDGRRVIVPMHNGHEIPTGTLLAILKDAKLSKTDVAELLTHL